MGNDVYVMGVKRAYIYAYIYVYHTQMNAQTYYTVQKRGHRHKNLKSYFTLLRILVSTRTRGLFFAKHSLLPPSCYTYASYNGSHHLS